MTDRVPVFLAGVPDLNDVVNTVVNLHREHADLRGRIIAAEDDYLRRIAQAHHAGLLDWKGLISAYEQLRAWSKDNGLGTFRDRWEARIEYDRGTLSRYAGAMPNASDGTTWTGNTGFDEMDGTSCPQRGMNVAFVLFRGGQTPVFIGFTHQFRNRLKTLDKEGLIWESWLAQLCDARQEAVEVRRDLVKRYGEPNIAARPATSR
ncbi:hypothetical protein BS329_15240 [Amycolatopsis coloradensis]|uniref:Uncharacterized protein n=1 Tax=Amycolatopsis coloradensis TaxID=76021 RepID=A0A1R0KU17_9PSEU|nr:hypothetical protein [Amycolatopsis coloradensis]OLZ51619.1 hypothetical protein BS329_15240 [Amycolatopsis coloradensis]